MALPWRHVFTALGLVGMAIIYGLKVNLSVAIVAMVNQTAVKQLAKQELHGGAHSNNTITIYDEGKTHLVCEQPNLSEEDTQSRQGSMVWTELEQGLVLGSYFWGYFITQVPGGRISELYSGKWVFFIAVVMNVVGALLSPICALNGGVAAFVAARVLQGLGGGLTFPAMNVLVAAWAPQQERSTMTAAIYGGTAIGTVISMPTAGIIASIPQLSWEGIFYLHGGLSCIWLILWAILVYDTPASHPFCSESEKTYITENQSKANKSTGPRPKIPWSKLITSVPFLALCLAHTINNFGWYMLLVELPTFMSVGLGFPISKNAGLSAVPFLCNWLFSIGYGFILDKSMTSGKISTTNGRKLSQLVASVAPAACLVGVCLAGCDKTVVVVLMILSTTLFGSMFSGVFSNHVDLASNFSGVLMGITNMVATIPGFLVPAMVGAMTHGEPGLAPWHMVFYITVGLLLVEALVYGCFASGEEQEWNHITTDDQLENEKGENKRKEQDENESDEEERKRMLQEEK